MRVAIIGSNRLYKIKEPLESAGIECIIIKNIKDIWKKVDIVIIDIAGLRIFLGYLLKRIHRAKLVYRGRGFFLKEIPFFKRFITSTLIRICDCSIFVSQNLKKEVSTQLNLSKSFVVGTPAPHLRLKQKERKKMLTVITLTNMDFLNKVKPIIKYVETVSKILKEIDGIWIIAGDGKYADEVRSSTAKLENVECPGFVDRNKILEKADIMLHLSELDAFPSAVLEGMAAGLPVIVNDYEPLKIGPAIVVKDKRELEEWLWKLYENPTLRRRIGLIGKKYVEKNYNAKVIGERYRKVLEQILT